jgi:hypothetical protein
MLVMDLSGATGRDTVQALRAAALELVVQLPPGVRVGLVRAGPATGVVVAPTDSRQRVSDAIAALAPAARSDLAAAARLAAGVPVRPRRHVVVFTASSTAGRLSAPPASGDFTVALHAIALRRTAADAVPLGGGCSQQVTRNGLVAAVDSVVSRIAGEYVLDVPGDRRAKLTISVRHAGTEAEASAAPEGPAASAGGTASGGTDSRATSGATHPNASSATGSSARGGVPAARQPASDVASSSTPASGPGRGVLLSILALCSLTAAFLALRKLVRALRRRRAEAVAATPAETAGVLPVGEAPGVDSEPVEVHGPRSTAGAESPAHGGDGVLDGFADELAAGAGVATALRALAERSPRRPATALRRLAAQVEAGGDAVEALRAAKAGRADERWRWAAVALEAAGSEGVPPERVVRRAAWVLAQRDRARGNLRAVTASSRLPFWFLAVVPAEGAAAGAVARTEVSTTLVGPTVLAAAAAVLAVLGLGWVGLTVRPPFRAWVPAIHAGRQLAGVRRRLVDVLHRAAVLAEAEVPVPDALRRAYASVDCSGARFAATASASGDGRPAQERAEELARLQAWTAERVGDRADPARRLGDVAGQLNDDELTEAMEGVARLPFLLLAPVALCLLPSAALLFVLLS